MGANYGQNIAITGGSCGSPCTLPVFSVVADKLPPGLFMPSTYGCCGDAIGGTPKRKGTFTFTIQVKDGAGNVARQAFSIEILRAAALEITFPATCCNDGTVGTSYLQNLFISGGVGPYTASISAGQLPPGLSVSASPPISITGTPTTPGTFTITVKVTDSREALKPLRRGASPSADVAASKRPTQARSAVQGPQETPPPTRPYYRDQRPRGDGHD